MLFDHSFVTERIPCGYVGLCIRHNANKGKPPLLLVHGFPQNHMMWHKLAPRLKDHYHLIMPDLRGYGRSDKPQGSPDHSTYSKRAMAEDLVELMDGLGYQRFGVVGHDRGARVVHRLCLDHPNRVSRACVMDILPTRVMYRLADREMASAYYHWFFLIQPPPLPERLLEHEAEYFLNACLRRWSADYDAAFDPVAVRDYIQCFNRPDTIHATCEDYRAAATIDLEHDEADADLRISCPLLVLWGSRGFVHSHYDVLAVWRDAANEVAGEPLDCGHFLPEERPEETAEHLLRFFGPQT